MSPKIMNKTKLFLMVGVCAYCSFSAGWTTGGLHTDAMHYSPQKETHICRSMKIYCHTKQIHLAFSIVWKLKRFTRTTGLNIFHLINLYNQKIPQTKAITTWVCWQKPLCVSSSWKTDPLCLWSDFWPGPVAERRRLERSAGPCPFLHPETDHDHSVTHC